MSQICICRDCLQHPSVSSNQVAAIGSLTLLCFVLGVGVAWVKVELPPFSTSTISLWNQSLSFLWWVFFNVLSSAHYYLENGASSCTVRVIRDNAITNFPDPCISPFFCLTADWEKLQTRKSWHSHWWVAWLCVKLTALTLGSQRIRWVSCLP